MTGTRRTFRTTTFTSKMTQNMMAQRGHLQAQIVQFRHNYIVQGAVQ